jgi:hypothetical protein
MMPAYESADDPRAFRQERAAHRRAEALIRALLALTGQSATRQLLPFDPEAAREASRQHFLTLARSARALRPDWQPSAFLRRAIKARGLSWAELERAL